MVVNYFTIVHLRNVVVCINVYKVIYHGSFITKLGGKHIYHWNLLTTIVFTNIKNL